MAEVYLVYSDQEVKDVVDFNSTTITFIKSTDKLQFRSKNAFVEHETLVLDSSFINDKEFIEWAICNTKKDLLVLLADSGLTFDVKKLKTDNHIEVAKAESPKREDIFGLLNLIMRGSDRHQVKEQLEKSVGLFPLLLKWLIGSVNLFNEHNQFVMTQIDELFMRRNNDAIIRNLAYGIKPETGFIKFQWAFPKAK